MEARIMAVAGVHRRLYTSSDVRFVEMGTYMAALVEDLRNGLSEIGQKRVIGLAAEAGIRMATDKAVGAGRDHDRAGHQWLQVRLSRRPARRDSRRPEALGHRQDMHGRRRQWRGLGWHWHREGLGMGASIKVQIDSIA
jgi:hypothetical protein